MILLLPYLKTLWTARAPRPAFLERNAWLIGPPLILLGVMIIYGMTAGRLVLNATDSLAARGFFVVAWPKPLIRGAVIVADPPAQFSDRFEGLYFTKHLGGLPGDLVRHHKGAVCIEEQCYARAIKNGAPFGTLLPAGPIPSGMVALFGETATSLDSRYGEVGFFPIETIRGVGFAIPGFPDWTVLADWMTS